jgi:lysophospholipase L1-like esterase
VTRRASLVTPYVAGELIGVGHPLYRWQRAYATRHYRPVTIGVIGDSVAGGAGVSTGPAPTTALGAYTRTLTYKLQQKLNGLDGYFVNNPLTPLNNNEYGSGGGGFVRTALTGFAGDPWTRVGSPIAVNRGIGMNSIGFNASNGSSTGTQYIEMTFKSWQSAIIWYETGAGSIAPGFTLYNSAGTVLNDNVIMAVNTGLAANTRAVIGFDVASAVRGQYKLRIGRNGASGTAVVDAVYFIDGDANSGVRVYNYSWPGMVSGDFNANNTAANSSAAAITVYQSPELLVIYLGANDYGTNVNPSTYQTNISQLIDKYRASFTKPPCVLLVAHWPRYDTVAPTFSWSQYVAALRAVAASKTESWEGLTVPYVDVLDLTPHFPSTAALDTANEGLVVANPTTGWGVHPTDRGHSWIAGLLADKLSQPTAM